MNYCSFHEMKFDSCASIRLICLMDLWDCFFLVAKQRPSTAVQWRRRRCHLSRTSSVSAKSYASKWAKQPNFLATFKTLVSRDERAVCQLFPRRDVIIKYLNHLMVSYSVTGHSPVDWRYLFAQPANHEGSIITTPIMCPCSGEKLLAALHMNEKVGCRESSRFGDAYRPLGDWIFH